MSNTITGQGAVTKLLNATILPPPVVLDFLKKIANNPALNTFFDTYFSTDEKSEYTPVFIYNERKQDTEIFVVDRREKTPEPGEQGSMLSIIRGFGCGDDYLPSDCYGQLSCSSCAIEVLSGKPENAEPRPEEFDMLDIDEAKPPTPFTRLGCQTVIGTDPLVIKIRR